MLQNADSKHPYDTQNVADPKCPILPDPKHPFISQKVADSNRAMIPKMHLTHNSTILEDDGA